MNLFSEGACGTLVAGVRCTNDMICGRGQRIQETHIGGPSPTNEPADEIEANFELVGYTAPTGPSLAPSPNMWHVVIELVLACPVRPRNKWVAKYFRVSSLVGSAVVACQCHLHSPRIRTCELSFFSLQLLPTNTGCRKTFEECLASVAFAVAMKRFQFSPAT